MKEIGPSDRQLAGANLLCTPKRLEKLSQNGVLKVSAPALNCLGGTLLKLRELGALLSVKELDCRKDYIITKEDLALIQQYKITLPNLRAVKIAAIVPHMTELLTLLADSKSLKTIELGTYARQVKEKEVEIICNNFKELEDITFNHLYTSMSYLTQFLTKYPYLRSLAIRYADRAINPELIQSLSQSCAMLESLEVIYGEIDGEPFKDVHFNNMHRFVLENLEGYEGSVDDAYVEVAAACPNLREAFISVYTPMQDTVTEVGLRALGTACPNITTLTTIGEAPYLKAAAECFPNLKKLE
jgi:hypothetical protein